MERTILSRLNRYVVALLVVFAAAGVRLLFTPWISSQVPFLTFYIAVMVASWLGGLGPGLFAAALCTVLANVHFMPPLYGLAPDSPAVFPVVVFILEAAAIAMISERWKLTHAAVQTREAALHHSLDAWRRSEEEFRTISEAAPALVWVCDQQGRNTFVNQSWCWYTGQTRDQARGFGWIEAMHPDDMTLPSGGNFPTTGDSYEGECRYRCHDGSYRWHAFRALPRLNADARIEAWYGVSVDITARKQAEEQLQRWTSELEQAVASRTQSLRQSEERLRALATELNLAEQRERNRLATELHDHLAQMLVLGRLKLSQARQSGQVSGQAAELLVETEQALTESLSYTRTLVADLAPPVLREFGLPAALRWLSDRMRQLDLIVTVDVQEAEDFTLPEDQAILLFQSARELLINVAKHAGSPDATLRLVRGDRQLRLEVLDKGTGFNPTDATGSTAPLASKFGLFSIRERMKALGGSFELESAIGRGTRAVMVLPMLENSSRPEAPQAESHVPATVPSSEAPKPLEVAAKHGVSRVLLVDDHVMFRQGLRRMLEGYGDVEIVGEVCNGEEAVAFVGAAQPAIVVMDVNMPKVNGIEATRDIKARYPHVIVIGLSVNPDRNTQALMKKAGADVFLSKEAAVEHLHSAIQRAGREQ
jgi:PAS domain S-box-containing protein